WTNVQGYYSTFIELLPKLAIAVLVFLFMLFVARRMQSFVTGRLSARMDDPLLARFLARAVKYVLVVVGLLLVLYIVGFGAAAASVLTGAGVGAFVIGFAFKDIGENLLAGVMLAFNRPFRVGDVVELNGTKGKVVTLNLRDTQIKTFDGKDIFIPNAAIIKGNVINYTLDGFMRYDFDLGLDYGSDVNQAQAMVIKALSSIEGVLKSNGKQPSVHLTSLGSSTMNLTVYYWVDTFDDRNPALSVKTEVLEKVLTIMDEAGFYLPGDILELKNYKDTPLKSDAAQALANGVMNKTKS
ncbi:MAG: mechanosensitive ion channel family protein, partial [Bacteroidota bacterium]